MNTTLAGLASWESEPAALPLPAGLPALPGHPRVLLLIDGDCVSRGLTGNTGGRACDERVRHCLGVAYATAAAIDPHCRIRCAVSSATAEQHLMVLATARMKLDFRYGRNGADWALLEELAGLIQANSAVTRRGHRPPAQRADLVILVAHDKIYAPSVGQLYDGRTPTWLLAPGTLVAAKLALAACAVTLRFSD